MTLLADLSNNNSGVAISQVPVPVLHKVSQGTYFTDAYYPPRRAAARVAFGGYHFCDNRAIPGNDPSPEAQASFFLARLGPVTPGGLRPMLDYEEPCRPDRSWLEQLVTVIRQKTGVTPAWYSGTSFANTLGHSATLAAAPFIRAEYGPNDGLLHPYLLRCVYQGAAHQFTSRARLAGCSGGVDLSYTPSLAPLLIPHPAQVARDYMIVARGPLHHARVTHVAEWGAGRGINLEHQLAAGHEIIRALNAPNPQDRRVVIARERHTTPPRVGSTR